MCVEPLIGGWCKHSLEEEVLDEVGALLEETHWDNPVKEIKSARDEIAGKLGLPTK